MPAVLRPRFKQEEVISGLDQSQLFRQGNTYERPVPMDYVP
jgi:hypothetical protein